MDKEFFYNVRILPSHEHYNRITELITVIGLLKAAIINTDEDSPPFFPSHLSIQGRVLEIKEEEGAAGLAWHLGQAENELEKILDNLNAPNADAFRDFLD